MTKDQMLTRDQRTIVRNKHLAENIVIIDELSGRPMEGRRYGDGLHQAIEA